jgi:hypothetical protein
MTDQAPDAAKQDAAPPVPQDDDDLRGFYFRQLIGSQKVQAVTAVCVVVVGVALAATVSPAIGGIGALVVLLIAFIACFTMANSRAVSAFYSAYAASRNLSYNGSRGSLPPVCELLRKGDARYTERTLTGALPGGPNGVLAHFTYEEESTDSDGNRETSYYHYTVVYCELPQLAPFVQELVCHRRSGFRFMDSAEDKFRKRQRVELESEKFDKEYESFCGEHDEMNRVRQVYEPSFIVWLADSAPKHFEWDVVAGTLVCSIKGQADSTAELDGMCAAAGVVAKRLFDEAGEVLPPASAAPTAPPAAETPPPAAR